MFLLEYSCVRHTLRFGFLDVADMCTVMVQGGMEIPAVYGLIVQGGTRVGILMYYYGASHQAKGCSVVVKGSKIFLIGRYIRCCI